MLPYAPSRRKRTATPPSEGAEIDMAEIDRIFETHKPNSKAASSSKQLQKTTGATSKANYRPYTKPSKSRQTTDPDMALDEITEGFRPGQKKRTQKKTGKGGRSDWDETSTAIHQLVFLPYGYGDPDLNGLRVPTARQIDTLVAEGFAIKATTKAELAFPNNLKSYTGVDKWLQSLLPKVFDSLLLHDPFTDSQVWSLLYKRHSKFELETNNPTSVTLRRASKTPGNNWMDRDLFFITTFPIPDIVEKIQPSGSGTSKRMKPSSDESDHDLLSSDVNEVAAGSSSGADNTSSHSRKRVKLLRAAKSVSNVREAPSSSVGGYQLSETSDGEDTELEGMVNGHDDNGGSNQTEEGEEDNPILIVDNEHDETQNQVSAVEQAQHEQEQELQEGNAAFQAMILGSVTESAASNTNNGWSSPPPIKHNPWDAV
ncbi:hypothetical protein M422DRAFT_264535 [Sphaerobolus stellatus SS14]|uniref:Uncharacterized protein n=1 Tax=Sphaerobolus stellatus (strain SS14) TaxID=990650 RepID=A0A0C9V818_SPHS4|nr:hypothetical protein M422DRAFT_264535 [Sphaerobolus stellatus SS14]